LTEDSSSAASLSQGAPVLAWTGAKWQTLGVGAIGHVFALAEFMES
jgi:hypothetical protein